ncbi:MAG: NAD(P)-binding domain-containing protein, partial [Rubrobacter sp.]|nr:NAD(P)-binding domain-containing protein [Rubrobacter sp.]
MAERVGFIGLGLMGKPMARNLLKAGYELTVHNRSRAAVDELAREGASAAHSPKEVAAASDITITMLPGPEEIWEIMAGEGGALESAIEGSLVVDMSTSSPLLARELDALARERGLGSLDAPVSGGDVGARQGTLSIMAGGAEEDFERARPLFEKMGETIIRVGEAGTGQTVKACNQVVVALTIEAFSEALVLGSKAGAEPEKILDALSGGLASNKV